MNQSCIALIVRFLIFQRPIDLKVYTKPFSTFSQYGKVVP